MPTDDERRAVAAKLREHCDQLTPYNLVDYLFEDPWNHNNGEDVADRLADLIEPEERTCRLTYDTVHDDMVCSSCGAWLDMVAYSELETSGQMRYCPACGAKVVDEDA